MTFCAACGKDVTPHVTDRIETFPVRGEAVEIRAKVAVCPVCGDDIFDEHLDARNLSIAYDRFRQTHQFMTPREIGSLRNRYGLSQKAFSQLLGWGEITAHRYESGSLQSLAHEAVLRLAENPENMRKLLEVNSGALAPKQRRSFEERLGLMSGADIACDDSALYDAPAAGSPSLLNGYRLQNIQKIRAMIAFFAGTPDMFVTKLAKLMFYADFLHFNRHTTSISGLTYCHLPYGPVPDKFDRIRGDAIESGAVEYIERMGPDWCGQLVVPGKDASVDALTDDELGILQLVAVSMGGKSAQALSAISHMELAYLETDMGQVISYNYADRLSVLVD